MSDEKQPNIVRGWATDEERKAAFAAYVDAVGKVSHAWNFLHERLGQLFLAILDGESQVSAAIWYSTEIDKAQRRMLLLAARASIRLRGKNGVLELIEWLDKKTTSLSDRRNDAIHAPCAFWLGAGPEGSPVMGASYLFGHPRAKKLIGLAIVEEFLLCERVAEELTRFTLRIESHIQAPERFPLPDKPKIPSLRLKR